VIVPQVPSPAKKCVTSPAVRSHRVDVAGERERQHVGLQAEGGLLARIAPRA
jgi:hypothetical protein